MDAAGTSTVDIGGYHLHFKLDLFKMQMHNAEYI